MVKCEKIKKYIIKYKKKNSAIKKVVVIEWSNI